MADPDVLVDPDRGSNPDGAHTPDTPDPAAPATVPAGKALLRQLNRRGFRLVMVLDALALALVMVGSMAARFGTSWPNYPQWSYYVSFAVALSVFVGALYFGGLYERQPRLGAAGALPRAVRQTLAAGGLLELGNLAATGIAREWLGFGGARVLPFPFVNLVILIVLGAFVVAANRQLAHVMRLHREGAPKVLLVGPPDAVTVARAHLAAEEGRYAIVGTVEERTGDVPAAVAASEATDVLLLDGDWLDLRTPDVLSRLEATGATALLRVSARESMLRLERVREVGGLPFVRVHAQTVPRSQARFKRLFDLSLLASAAPLWVPVLAAVALYQVVVAGRPLLYWQQRVGAGGRTFAMVKFRTMRPDAEADGRGARLASRDDDRVVPACRWVRASRMDELPQLWNVLRGDMSLVGPRPERPELTAGFAGTIAGYERRHEVPPGLTGLAQIHGRYHTDAEYKLGYDLQYLVNWSPVLDLEILLRTVWVVVTRRL